MQLLNEEARNPCGRLRSPTLTDAATRKRRTEPKPFREGDRSSLDGGQVVESLEVDKLKTIR